MNNCLTFQECRSEKPRDVDFSKEVFLCRKLQDMLKLDTQPLPLYMILGKAADHVKQHGNVLLQDDHFARFQSLSKDNLIDLISCHSHPFPPSQRQKFFLCMGCPFSAPTAEKLENHNKLGPFAENHIFHNIARQNNEILIKTILTYFIQDEGQFVCTTCNHVFLSLDPPEIFAHCLSHGSDIEDKDLSYKDVGKNLDTLLRAKSQLYPNEIKLHACLACCLLFETVTEMYVHCWIHSHTSRCNYCSICNADITCNMVEHIKRFHADQVGEHFLPEWDVELDDNLHLVIENAKEYAAWEKRSEGFSGMEKNVLSNYSMAGAQKLYNDFIPLHPVCQITQLDLMEITKYISNEKYTPGQLFYPDNPGDSELRRAIPLLPKPLPPTLKQHLAIKFPGSLNAFTMEPGYQVLTNETKLFDHCLEYLSLQDIFPPNKKSFPIFLFGTEVLKGIVISNNGQTLSYNGSPKQPCHWPTDYSEGQASIPQNNDPTIDLSFFPKLECELVALKEYKGLCFIETSIQHLLNPTSDNKVLAFQLARGFIFNFLAMKNRPKYTVLIGSINSLPGKIKSFGPAIALYNGYLKNYALKNNLTFLDPNVLAVRTLLTKSGEWEFYTPAGIYAPNKIFDYAGGLSLHGTFAYAEWIFSFAKLAKRVANQLEIDLDSANV